MLHGCILRRSQFCFRVNDEKISGFDPDVIFEEHYNVAYNELQTSLAENSCDL